MVSSVLRFWLVSAGWILAISSPPQGVWLWKAPPAFLSDPKEPLWLETTMLALPPSRRLFWIIVAQTEAVFWYSRSVYIVFNTLCTLLHFALGDLIKQVLKCCTNLDTLLAGGSYMLCMLISPPLRNNAGRPNVETVRVGTCHPVQDILSLRCHLST